MDKNNQDSSRQRVPTAPKILKMIKRRFPIFTWLPQYTKSDAISDLIAGVTVGLTVVPQSMAYSAIAGLGPEYGLYSSYLGVLIYVLLGSCRQCTIGPTAVIGLLTFQTCQQDYPACAILTGFYGGVFELLMAILQLGWVVSFISEPVTIGFTSGAALTIMSSQVHSFLGLVGDKGSGFLGYWKAIIKNIGTIHAGDAVLGICSFIALMLLRKLTVVNVKSKPVKTAFWLISLSRNVIIIILTSIMAFVWQDPPFKLVGTVHGGFPSFKPPQFQLPIMHRPESNGTLVESGEYYSFWDSWSVIKTGPLVIALVSVLQNVAISKAFGAGQAVDAAQEMVALGTTNVIGSFISSIPVTASFSRSAVNEASGVKTQFGGLYTGILVLLSLSFLTPSFYYIPKSSLAAVIIGAVVFMIDYESLVPMFKISKIDCVTCLITFICALFLGMEYGILIGVGISILALLLRTLRPEMKCDLKTDQASGKDYLLITPGSGLNFPSVDHISTTIQKFTLKHKEYEVVILDFAKWTNSDYTAANTLMSLNKGLKKNGKIIGFLHCSETWVEVFKFAGLSDPPSIKDEDGISDFIKKKLNLSSDKDEPSRGSLDSVVVGVVKGGVVTEANGGFMEGVGTISMASMGSSIASVASSTKPIL